MALHWSSWEEFIEYVHPSMVRSQGLFKAIINQPSFMTILQIEESRHRLESALNELKDLGFSRQDIVQRKISKRTLQEAHTAAINTIRAGEELLLYYERLARDDVAYGFLHQNDLPDHWHRYTQQGNVSFEIFQLYKDALHLLDGFLQLIEDDRCLLSHQIELPPELEADFRTARNLFSTGFDEVALFIAGRGLERVLRTIAKARSVTFEIKGNTVPAWEATFNDLIEGSYRLRWKTTDERLIDSKTRALLHYLRERRNEGAHPISEVQTPVSAPRETAIIVTKTAEHLWIKTSDNRARFASNVVKKSW